MKSLALYEPVAFSVLAAEERSDVERVSALSGDLETWLAQFVDWWNGTGAWDALPEPTKDAFRKVGAKVSQEVASLATDRSDYSAISVPTLLMTGNATRPVERLVVEKLAATMPRARLVRFDGLGHMGPIVASDAINAEIKTHIDSLSS